MDPFSGGSGSPLTIGTRRGTAGIHLLLTVKARKAPRTAAGVPALGVVGAPAPIEAGAVGTHHGTQLAHPAVEAGWAGAGVAVLKVLSDGEDEESFPSRSQGPTRSASDQGSARRDGPRRLDSPCSSRRSCKARRGTRPPPSRSRPPCTQAGRSTCSSLGPCWCRWRRSCRACGACSS